jgi:hypothetical protein
MTMREKFEAWLPDFCPRDRFIDDEGDWLYADTWVQGAWIGYRAAYAAGMTRAAEIAAYSDDLSDALSAIRAEITKEQEHG